MFPEHWEIADYHADLDRQRTEAVAAPLERRVSHLLEQLAALVSAVEPGGYGGRVVPSEAIRQAVAVLKHYRDIGYGTPYINSLIHQNQ